MEKVPIILIYIIYRVKLLFQVYTDRHRQEKNMINLKNLIIVIFISLIVSNIVFADNYLMVKSTGGLLNEIANYVTKTPDNSLIITGQTFSYGAGGSDIFVMKYNNTGNLEWFKTIGGTSYENAMEIQVIANNSLILAGCSDSYGDGVRNGIIIKMNLCGNVEWAKSISAIRNDEINTVQETDDGGLFLTGRTTSSNLGNYDVLILKLDSSGNLQWGKIIGGNGYDNANSAQQTSDQGYIIAGSTESSQTGNYDLLLIKINKTGNTEWIKKIGGNGFENADSVKQCSDDGYIVSGYSETYSSGGYDIIIIKVSQFGEIEWSKNFGGIGDEMDRSISQTQDNGFILGGYTKSYPTLSENQNVLVAKISPKGEIEWTKVLSGSSNDSMHETIQLSKNNYVGVGYTESFGEGAKDILILKVNDTDEMKNCPQLQSVSATIMPFTPTISSHTLENIEYSPNIKSISPIIENHQPIRKSVCYQDIECYTEQDLSEAVEKAISNMFTQEQLDEAIIEATLAKDQIITQLNSSIASMYTQGQLDNAVLEAKKGLYSNDDVNMMINKLLHWDIDNDGAIGLIEAIQALKESTGIKSIE